MSYYVKTGFRLSDDVVGLMQYRMIDENVSVERVAQHSQPRSLAALCACTG